MRSVMIEDKSLAPDSQLNCMSGSRMLNSQAYTSALEVNFYYVRVL
jgi:hypothetical protein